MINADFARKLTEICRHPGVHFKKIDIYVPRTWNIQLDDILEDVIKRSSKGYTFLESKYTLQPTTAKELQRLGFVLEFADLSHYIIQW